MKKTVNNPCLCGRLNLCSSMLFSSILSVGLIRSVFESVTNKTWDFGSVNRVCFGIRYVLQKFLLSLIFWTRRFFFGKKYKQNFSRCWRLRASMGLFFFIVRFLKILCVCFFFAVCSRKRARPLLQGSWRFFSFCFFAVCSRKRAQPLCRFTFRP